MMGKRPKGKTPLAGKTLKARTKRAGGSGTEGTPDPELVRKHVPLSPRLFQILVALAKEPLNGYQLGLEVEQASGGLIPVSPGTLYENIDRMRKKGLIEEAVQNLPVDGRGQKFWTLTTLGIEVLRLEVARLRSALETVEGLPSLAEGGQ